MDGLANAIRLRRSDTLPVVGTLWPFFIGKKGIHGPGASGRASPAYTGECVVGDGVGTLGRPRSLLEENMVETKASGEREAPRLEGPVVPDSNAEELEWEAFVDAHPPEYRDGCPLVELWRSRGEPMSRKANGDLFMPEYRVVIGSLKGHARRCGEITSDCNRARIMEWATQAERMVSVLETFKALGRDFAHREGKSALGYGEVTSLVSVLSGTPRGAGGG